MSESNERWAFLSIEDMTGIVDFAKGIIDCGYRIVATPGTHAFLAAAKVDSTAVQEITEFPIILGGLVKSMHPRILAGILADREDPDTVRQCKENKIPLFDLVVINSACQHGYSDSRFCKLGILISPMAIVRAAASNYKQVAILTRPQEYAKVLSALQKPAGIDETLRLKLARNAWNMAIHYDITVAPLFEADPNAALPNNLRCEYKRLQELRYGENPQQQAALYASPILPGPCIAGTRLLAGTTPSYNNIVDADVGLNLVLEFAAPGAVIVKHAIPVSAAIGTSIAEAMEKTFMAEWAANVGAAIACNGIIDETAAHAIAQPGRSIDLILATDFTTEAIEILRNTTGVIGALRLLKVGDMHYPAGTCRCRRVAIHHVSGGILAQTVDDGVYGPGGFHITSRREPSDQELIDLEFACLIAKHARSHATVLAKNGATVAVGTAQTNRAEASNIALQRGGDRVEGCVMASDDVVNLGEVAMLAKAGVKAIIHTGGSPEEEVPLLKACDEKEIAMVVTRMRHFSHV